MNPKNLIAIKLRTARLSENPICTQRDLSARLEILGVHLTEKAISKIENGDQEVKDYQLVAFAKALKVRILWLLGEE